MKKNQFGPSVLFLGIALIFTEDIVKGFMGTSWYLYFLIGILISIGVYDTLISGKIRELDGYKRNILIGSIFMMFCIMVYNYSKF